MKKQTINIRWHGRGGQGAITAAKIVANAAFESDYKGVVMIPTFGTERRGAPVMTSLKISREKINDLSPITEPDMVVVLDHMLLEEVDIAGGLIPGGLIVLNTPCGQDAYEFKGMRLATANVSALAGEVGLPKGIVNSGIIGAFARASGLFDLELLLKGIEKEFADKKPRKNAESAKLTYDHTVIGE